VRSTNIVAHAAIGRIGRPAFPAPFDQEGGTNRPNLARNLRRDRGIVFCRHCEERSDEAIHRAARKKKESFARNDDFEDP
jgi:hypothetical protein